MAQKVLLLRTQAHLFRVPTPFLRYRLLPTPTEQTLIHHSELVAALKQLTDGERKLLYFFYFDGYSAKEIAALLELTGPKEMRMEKSRVLLKLSELLNVK